jgi:hypothetical protein
MAQPLKQISVLRNKAAALAAIGWGSNMAETDGPTSTSIPAREIPIPAHLRPQAQAMLVAPPIIQSFPPLEDKAAWRAHVAAVDEMVRRMMAGFAKPDGVDVEDRELDGVPLFVATPQDADWKLPGRARRAWRSVLLLRRRHLSHRSPA